MIITVTMLILETPGGNAQVTLEATAKEVRDAPALGGTDILAFKGADGSTVYVPRRMLRERLVMMVEQQANRVDSRIALPGQPGQPSAPGN